MRVALDGATGLTDAMAAFILQLVALLKNADRRAEHAIQIKLDRLAEALLAERRKHSRESASDQRSAPCGLA